MTIGDGIFYSTILLVLAGSIYAISIKGAWKVVGKVFGVLVLAGMVVGGALVGYEQYQNRPQPAPKPEELVAATEFMGIELGAPRVDVTLSKGAPEFEGLLTQAENNRFFQNIFYEDFYVELAGEEDASLVSRVCTRDGVGMRHNLLGVRRYTSEDDLLALLGAPTLAIIFANGTAKRMIYEALNVSFIMRKRRVDQVCMVDPAPILAPFNLTPEDASQ